MNCQSLLTHLEFLVNFERIDYHAIYLSKTWLKPDISDDLIALHGYLVLRCDQLGRRGWSCPLRDFMLKFCVSRRAHAGSLSSLLLRSLPAVIQRSSWRWFIDLCTAAISLSSLTFSSISLLAISKHFIIFGFQCRSRLCYVRVY